MQWAGNVPSVTAAPSNHLQAILRPSISTTVIRCEGWETRYNPAHAELHSLLLIQPIWRRAPS
jgi:hypothetical protein